eukprot:15158018-Ditylum_brightwellii.AAC.1
MAVGAILNLQPAMIYSSGCYLGHRKGEKFILGGNFKESLMTTSDMINFGSHDDLKLIDILGDHTQESFSTTKTGKQCIDYLLISPELKQSVRHMGYLAFDWLIYTDHREMYIDFSTNAVYGDDHVKIV